jgi:hypothetical protein
MWLDVQTAATFQAVSFPIIRSPNGGNAMRGRPILILAFCGLLAGCEGSGTSNLNPFNWFGGGPQVETALAPDGLPADPRPLIDQVTEVVLDRAPGGVIVRATGLPPTLGYWNAALVPIDRELRPDDNGDIAIDFRALPPVPAQPAGSPAARQIVTGYFLSEQTLRNARSVTVRAERNARSVRP